jgi:type I restriction enzyme S subunit
MASDRILAETGLSWQPTMSTDWELTPVKAMLTRQNRRVGESSATLTLLSLTKRGVIVRDLSEMKGKFASSMDTYQHVSAGDFVFCLFDVDETPRTVGQSSHSGMITGAYKVLKPTNLASARFLEYLLISIDDVKGFKPLYRGLRKTLPYEVFKGIKLAIPGVDEQELIVRYLDHAELRIATAIRAKQKMVALLNEQKQVLAEEWLLRCNGKYSLTVRAELSELGPIPDHWALIPCRYLFREVTRNDLLESDPKLSLSLSRGLVRSREYGIRADHLSSSLKFKRCEPGDIVLNKYRAYLGAFAHAYERGLITPNYTVLAPQKASNSQYFAQLFSTSIYRTLWRHMSYGVGDGMMPLYTKNFYRVKAVCPPAEDVEYILHGLSEATLNADLAISAVEREIELLKEYRTVLISDVVTGKKDVRAEAASLPDVDPAELAFVLSGAVSVDGEEDEVDGASEAE